MSKQYQVLVGIQMEGTIFLEASSEKEAAEKAQEMLEDLDAFEMRFGPAKELHIYPPGLCTSYVQEASEI